MSNDEGNPRILEALSTIGGIIEDVTASILNDLDEAQAALELERTNGNWKQWARLYEQARATLKDIRGYLDRAERREITEREAMALIRGLFHE